MERGATNRESSSVRDAAYHIPQATDSQLNTLEARDSLACRLYRVVPRRDVAENTRGLNGAMA
jgi:hypothetical protein